MCCNNTSKSDIQGAKAEQDLQNLATAIAPSIRALLEITD